MELKLMTSAKRGSKFEVSDAVFAREYSEGLVHQVLTTFMSNARAGTRKQKTRAEVRGGGIKPWKQKGMGRARAGTIRSPLWRHGGKIFAARPQDHSTKINRKMYRAAVQCILSELVRQERLILVKDFSVSAPKTKELLELLKQYEVQDVLIVTESADQNLYLAARNLYRVDIVDAEEMNPLDLIKHERVIMTEEAIKRVQERLA